MKWRLRSWEQRLLYPTPCADMREEMRQIRSQIAHAEVYEPDWAKELRPALELKKALYQEHGCV